MRNTWKLFAVAVLAAAVAGMACRGGTRTYYAVAYKGKLTEADKFVIMPVDIHGFPKKDLTKMNLSLFAGTIAAFGGQALSLQPFLPAFEAAGFRNLSWRLARGIYHLAAFHRTTHFDRCVGHLSWMPEMLNAIVKFIGWAAQTLKLDFQPKYVVSAHVDGYGAKWGGKVKPYRVIGGMVDAPKKLLIGATWYRSTCPNNTAGYMAAMGTLGKQIMGAMKPLFAKE